MQWEQTATGLSSAHGGPADATPVVFVHGAMDRGTAFLRVTRLLPGVRWWIYDRRGYGRSVGHRPVDIDGHVDDLLALLDTVAAETSKRAVVVGHSLGGTVALAAAHRHPDRAAAAVAYESPLSWLDWWPRPGNLIDAEDPARAAEEFMRRVAGEDVWDGLPETTRQRRRREGPALVAELASVDRAAPYVPAEIVVPVTIAHGSRADERRRRASAVLGAEIPGAEIVVLDGAGHGAHLSHPEAFAGLVRGVMARAGSAATDRSTGGDRAGA